MPLGQKHYFGYGVEDGAVKVTRFETLEEALRAKRREQVTYIASTPSAARLAEAEQFDKRLKRRVREDKSILDRLKW